MKKRRIVDVAKYAKYLIILSLVLGLGTFVFGQNAQDTSNTADKNLKSLGRVNPLTLAMELSIPLGNYPGRAGNSTPVVLNYSSKVWDMKMTNFRHEVVPAETNPYFTHTAYESTDISPLFSEKTSAGWTSSLQPVAIIQENDVYNEWGESYYADVFSGRSKFCRSSLESGDDWVCEVLQSWFFTNNSCESGLALWVEFGCHHPNYEYPEVITGWNCVDDPSHGPGPVPSSTPEPQTPQEVHRLRIQTSDGATHEFRKDDQVHNCGTHPEECGSNYDLNGRYLSVDGTGMRLQKGEVQPVTEEVRDVLYLPNGSKYIFPEQNSEAHYDIAEKYVDQNGNVSHYDISQATWTDTLGRTIDDPMVNPSYTGVPLQPGSKTYYIKGIDEEPLAYQMNWAKLDEVLEDPNNTSLKYLGEDTCQGIANNPVPRDFLFQNQPLDTPADPIDTNGIKHVRRQRACSMTYGGSPVFFDPVVLSYIELPNGKRYEFKYNEYGEITKIIYPTGSYERFEYGKVNTLGFTALEVYSQAIRGVTKKYVSFDGTSQNEQIWNYTDDTTTAPDGSSTQRRFYPTSGDWQTGSAFGFSDPRSGMVKEEKVKDTNGVLRSRTLYEWVNTDPRDSGVGYRDARLKRSVTIIFEPGSNAALATLSKIEYDDSGSTDPSYFSHLNIKRKKAYHYAVIPNKTTVDDEPLDWNTIEGWFSNVPLAADVQTNYSYSQDFWNRGIIGLPWEIIAWNPSNSNEILSQKQMFYDDGTNYPLINAGTSSSWENPSSGLRGNVTTARTLLKDPVANTNTWIETHAQYDNFGNLRKAWDAAGNVTETEYSSEYNYAYLTAVIVPAPESNSSGAHGTTEQSKVATTYDLMTGLPLTVTDLGVLSASSDDRTTTTQYNDLLLRPTKVTAQNNQETITEYHDTPDSNGRISVKVKKQLDENNWDEVTTFMDKGGRTLLTQAKDSQGDIFVENHYDSVGRVDRVTNPYRTGDTVYWNKTRFDEISRAVESYAPATLADITNNTLTSLGTTSFNFSTSADIGTVVISEDASKRKRRSITNALGQLIRVDEPTAFGDTTADQDLGPVGNPLQPTYYTYSKLGKMVKVQQGVQSRYFLYDNLGRLLRVKQPEQEANTALAFNDPISGNSSWSAAFTYDIRGNVLTATDAKGTVISNSYDNAGRVKSRSYSGEPSGISTPQVDYYYDGLGLSGTANFAKGKMTRITSSVSETRYTNFDNAGRVLSSEQITDGQTYPMSYKYNLSGALTEETYPSGEVVRNFVESDGDLSRIAVSGHTYASDFSYTATGRIASLHLGNGRWETGKLNAREQVTEIDLGTAVNDGSLWKIQYEYGELNTDGSINTSKNNGSIAKQTTTFSGLSNSLVQTYKYDALDRLTEAKEPTGASTNNWVQSFGYDRYGNRASFNQSGFASITQTPSIDANTNRFAANQGFSYDKNGNIVNDPESSGRSFVFDGDNKQIQVKNNAGLPIGTYCYDGNGKRVKKVADSDTTVFVYDANGLLVAEYSGQVSPNPTISYTATDPLGSPRVITDKSGNIISRRDFMPFGEELNAGVGSRSTTLKYATTGADNLRKRFTGYEKDTETGLDFAEARYYNNANGRFTAVDPLLASGKSANPQTFNRYVYVLNNPLIFVDPEGKQTTTNPDDSNLPRGYTSNGYVWDGESWYDPVPAAPVYCCLFCQQIIESGYNWLNNSFTRFQTAAQTGNASDQSPRVFGNRGNRSDQIIDAINQDIRTGLETSLSIDPTGQHNLVQTSVRFHTGQASGAELAFSGISAATAPLTLMGGSTFGRKAVQEGIEFTAPSALRFVKPAATEAGTFSVYYGFDGAGVVRYIGATGRDPAVRFLEHMRATGSGREFLRYDIIFGATNLTKTQARTTEQIFINQYGLSKNGGTLFNKINSIAPKYWGIYGVTPHL